MTALLEQEQYVDSTSRVFLEKMDAFARTHEVIDFGLWLRYYAFDVIGELTVCFFLSLLSFMFAAHFSIVC